MTPKRLVIPSFALALVACAAPQGPTEVGAFLHGAAEGSTVPAVNAAQDPTLVRGEEGAAANKVGEHTQEPRIIRGNDIVIAPAKASSTIQGEGNTFKFEDAPISEVVHVMMREILKVDYVLHQPVVGSVTLVNRAPVSADNALAMLEAALQANGLVMVRDTRGVYHVGKADVLRNIGTTVRQPSRGELPAGFGVIVVPLQYIGASEMASILKPMMPNDALVRVDNTRNLLVLVGTRVQAEGWLDLINTFDVDLLKGMSVGVFPLKYATVSEVEAALQLLGGAAGTSGAAASTATARSTGQVASPVGGTGAIGGQGSTASVAAALNSDGFPLRGAMRILPIARINSILIVTPRAAYLDEARRWIDKLDQPSDNGADPQLFIYRVQNGNAQHLAGVLAGIFGGPAGTSYGANSGVAPGLGSVTAVSAGVGAAGYGATNPWGGALGRSNSTLSGSSGFGGGGALTGLNRLGVGASGLGAVAGGAGVPVAANLGNIRVMADTLNNTVLVWSTKGEFQKIESTLKRLDLPPTQVLIEASIIEVTLNDALKYGVQWAFNGSPGNGYTDRGQLSTGVNNSGNTGSLNVAAGGGFSYSLINPAGKVRVILDALASKTMVKMVSNPSLMVLDNHAATMAVGNQVPVLTSTTDYISNTNAITSTVQYRDTGVNLAVTPSVNSGNLVTMQIDQTVTDVTDNTSGTGNNQPIFLQRQISSKVAVRSGESIVLGGLIKDSQTTGRSGLPILQDLPVVGNLFGSNNNTGGRTELIVVITPRVVRTDPEIREVSEELRDRLKGLEIIDLKNRVNTSMPTKQSSPSHPQQPN